MKASMQSTGRAVFLSAVTTVIGFISLIFTPMAPIKTVGIALSGGIVIVYILTMFMVPNLTLILIYVNRNIHRSKYSIPQLMYP